MSDKIPGSSYDNPIWYKTKWRIYVQDNGACPFKYAYVHDDYDGAEDSNDHRCGHGNTIDECKAQIDDHD